MPSEVQTEFLVVGAGPAGAALASFLGQNGMYTWVSWKSPAWPALANFGAQD